MKKYLLYPFLLFSITFSAQPIIEWQKSIGGSSYDFARNIIQTSDGGYIAVLYSASNDGDITGNHGGMDLIIQKMSANGTVEWQKIYGGTMDESISKFIATTDGGYAIIGTTSSNDGDVSGNHGLSDIWMVKITSLGIMEWQKCFGGTNYERGDSIQQTTDGGYVIGGTAGSNNGQVSGNHSSSGGSDLWVVKLTSTGTIVWQKCLGSLNNDSLSEVRQTRDGGYIVNGDVWSNGGDVTGYHGNDDPDFWVVKLNSTGFIEWQKALGGNSWETGKGIIQNTEGDYIAVGVANSNDGDVTNLHGGGDGWVVKLGATGNIIWQKAFGGTDSDWFFYVRQTADGGYLFSGDSMSNDGQATGNHNPSGNTMDWWIVKATADGDFVWSKMLGGTANETAVCAIPTLDGGYMVSGYTDSTDGDITTNHGQWDGWIVKLNSELNIDDNELEESISLYPNPSNNVFNINSREIIQNIKVVDVLGKQVYNNKQVNELQTAVDVSNWAKGVYMITIEITSKTSRTLKFIKN
jgi:hypothetical protein